MADKVHSLTDKKLEAMERHLSAIYSRASKEIGNTWKQYLKDVGKEIEELQKAYDEAKRGTDRDAIKKAGIELSRVKREKTLKDKHYRNLSNQTAVQMANINKMALSYVNGKLPEIYSINYNASADMFDGIKGYSFELVNPKTIEGLVKKDKSLLPTKKLNVKKDKKWSTKKMNAEVLQGILQGESMDKIARRLSNVERMHKDSAIRNARTMVTGAENRGRLDSYVKAQEDGVILEKEWISTNDDRTRETHALMNGETVPIDEPFSNGLMYPADASGEPAEVYNCRCTMIVKVKGFKSK